MSKHVSALSVPLRPGPAAAPAIRDRRASSDFRDTLDAAEQAAQQPKGPPAAPTPLASARMPSPTSRPAGDPRPDHSDPADDRPTSRDHADEHAQPAAEPQPDPAAPAPADPAPASAALPVPVVAVTPAPAVIAAGDTPAATTAPAVAPRPNSANAQVDTSETVLAPAPIPQPAPASATPANPSQRNEPQPPVAVASSPGIPPVAPKPPAPTAGIARNQPPGGQAEPATAAKASPPDGTGLATLVDAIQRITGLGADAISLADGPVGAATRLPAIGTPDSTLPPPAATAEPPPAPDVLVAPYVEPSTADSGNGSADPQSQGQDRPAGQDTDPHRAHAGGEVPATQTIPATTPIGEARPAAAATGAASSVETAGSPWAAGEVAQSVVVMARNCGTGQRLSISLAPGQLGQVNVVVAKAHDGTTTIHVSAEHLATLDLLRKDQADLTSALGAAGIATENYSLSFSWQGGSGTTPGWNAPGQPPAEYHPASVAAAYADEPAVLPPARTARSRGIDLTA